MADKGEDYTMTEAVKKEIAAREKEEQEKAELRKKTVKERMEKLAAGQGTSPGFATAGIGAEIAGVMAQQEGGKIKVKDVAAKVDEKSDK